MKHPTDGSFHPSFILKLQTARFPTLFKLQTRDLVQNDRLDVLYHPVGVLDLEKDQKPSKNPKNCFFLDPQKNHEFSPLEPLWGCVVARFSTYVASRLYL